MNETVSISTLAQCKFGMVRWLTLLIATWLMDADMVVDERVALPDISNSVPVHIGEPRGTAKTCCLNEFKPCWTFRR